MSDHSWVSKIQSLPVLPQVAMRVTERMQSPTATLQEISDLIKSDIGLSTKILRLANSSYYSIPGGVNDVPKALQYLGFTTIAQIVLTASVFGAFKATGTRDFPLSQFWIHCFAVGQMAEVVARTLQHKNTSDAFIGGLMHDVGKLILLELAPEQLSKIVHSAIENKTSFLKAEETLGFQNHISLGLELASIGNYLNRYCLPFKDITVERMTPMSRSSSGRMCGSMFITSGIPAIWILRWKRSLKSFQKKSDYKREPFKSLKNIFTKNSRKRGLF